MNTKDPNLAVCLIRSAFEAVSPYTKMASEKSEVFSELYFRLHERLAENNFEQTFHNAKVCNPESGLVDDLARIFYLSLCSHLTEEQYDLQLFERLKVAIQSVFQKRVNRSYLRCTFEKRRISSIRSSTRRFLSEAENLTKALDKPGAGV